METGTNMNKIMMMIWSSRLEEMAIKKHWIHRRQFGFVKGKTMKGAADLASAIIDRTKNVQVMQCDIERAFPSISSKEVSIMLSNLGAPLEFTQILDKFYEEAPVSAVVGGKPGGEFKQYKNGA